MSNIQKFTVYGERCTGTNYVTTLVLKNFDVELTWELGKKHFFGFQEQELKEKSGSVLIIGLTREITEWINSFYREKHHIPLRYKNLSQEESIYEFLNEEFYSIDDMKHEYKTWKNELMNDRNIYTGERYKNIYELRHIKHKFLIEDMPRKVKHYIFLRYEDFINDFEKTMYRLKEMGLKVRDGIQFPINTNNYKDTTNIYSPGTKKNHIPKKTIIENPSLNPYYEYKLRYFE